MNQALKIVYYASLGILLIGLGFSGVRFLGQWNEDKAIELKRLQSSAYAVEQEQKKSTATPSSARVFAMLKQASSQSNKENVRTLGTKSIESPKIKLNGLIFTSNERRALIMLDNKKGHWVNEGGKFGAQGMSLSKVQSDGVWVKSDESAPEQFVPWISAKRASRDAPLNAPPRALPPLPPNIKF